MVNSVSCPENPPDALFALVARHKEDKSPQKVDMSIGAYRDSSAKPWVLPSVHKAEEQLLADPSVNHEYLSIRGNPEFLRLAAQLVLGDKFDPSKVASVQTLSGTGANHQGAVFLKRFPPFDGKETPKIYVSSPTWSNHHTLFSWAGLPIVEYPYWDAKTKGLDFTGMINSLKSANRGDIVLLHACAHNPTGVDPTQEQWKEIAKVCKDKQLFVFFDSAYQGFASGDLDNDAWAIRYFVDQKIPLLICQSFSKNMGLYGERAGALHFVLPDVDEKTRKSIESQLQYQTRAEVSNCPGHGARIAEKILGTPELYDQWKKDIKTMADRILAMRASLKGELAKLGTPGTWDHLTSQIGMFSFTGLAKDQVKRLVDEFHVYLAGTGRISIAGINDNNVKYIAKSVDTVVRGAEKPHI